MTIVYLLLLLSHISIIFSDEVFQNAGSNLGIQAWDIIGPAEVEPQYNLEGEMKSDEARVILNTIQTYHTTEKERRTHYWLGSQVSDEKKEAAAKYAMKLWNQGERNGQLYREVEDYESEFFWKYITTEPYEKWYIVKGEKYPRIVQIPPDDEEMIHRDDLIVSDSPLGILVFNEEKHSYKEKQAEKELVYRLQQDDTSYRRIFDTKRDPMPDLQSTITSAAEFEEERNAEVKLFRIVAYVTSSTDCQSNLEEVQGDKPFLLSVLDSNECFVLDSKSLSGVFVWVGKNVSPVIYEECMVHGEELFQEQLYSYPATVTIMKEGQETTQFLMQFRTLTTRNASEPKEGLSVESELSSKMQKLSLSSNEQEAKPEDRQSVSDEEQSTILEHQEKLSEGLRERKGRRENDYL